MSICSKFMSSVWSSQTINLCKLVEAGVFKMLTIKSGLSSVTIILQCVVAAPTTTTATISLKLPVHHINILCPAAQPSHPPLASQHSPMYTSYASINPPKTKPSSVNSSSLSLGVKLIQVPRQLTSLDFAILNASMVTASGHWYAPLPNPHRLDIQSTRLHHQRMSIFETVSTLVSSQTNLHPEYPTIQYITLLKFVYVLLSDGAQCHLVSSFPDADRATAMSRTRDVIFSATSPTSIMLQPCTSCSQVVCEVFFSAAVPTLIVPRPCSTQRVRDIVLFPETQTSAGVAISALIVLRLDSVVSHY